MLVLGHGERRKRFYLGEGQGWNSGDLAEARGLKKKLETSKKFGE